MSTWNKKTLATAVSVALGLGAVTSVSAETVKIAIAGPITGAVAQYGDMEFTGGRMAVELLNKSGRLGDYTLEAAEYDDACDPKQAVAVANKVVNDNILFVVGHLCSDSTLPASDVYDDEGIMMITPASTNPVITERNQPLVMRTIGLDSDQGPTAAKYILEKAKPERIAIVHDKKQYGEGLAGFIVPTGFTQFFDKNMIRLTQQVCIFFGHFTEDTHTKAWTGEWVTVNHIVRQTQLHTQLAHFVFKQLAQWFDQLELHIFW